MLNIRFRQYFTYHIVWLLFIECQVSVNYIIFAIEMYAYAIKNYVLFFIFISTEAKSVSVNAP